MSWYKNQGKYAKEQGDYAKSQGKAAGAAANSVHQAIDEAEQVAAENKTRFLDAVDTVAKRDTTYPNPQHGDTVRVTSTATTYRFVTGTGWVKTDEYNPTVIDNITQQLADIRKQVASSANLYYDATLGEYVNLREYWNMLRTGKKYTVEFNQYSVTPSPLGTKKDDNTGLVCEPSTNTVKGRNDYENIGLFMSVDVNAYVDANDDYHVTAIKGDGRFKADGTNGDVYVMAMPGYIKRYFDNQKWSISYSDVQHPGYEILDEAVKPDGTIRPYLLHAKYVAGRGKDGKLGSISGVYPEYVSMDHNSQITKFKEKGVQYSGKTTHDDFYTTMMFYLKYATTHSQSIMAGCSSYYNQYVSSVVETGVKRIIISNSNATGIEVGSCVSIGDFAGSTQTADRQSTLCYNVANRVKVLSKEPMPDGVNTAINLDVSSPINITATTTITTYPWISGACDNVKGQDGSPTNNANGREPFIINGIEMMVGGYEIIQNTIINLNNSTAYKVEVFANYDCHTYATSITPDYHYVGELAQTNSNWSYITKVAIPQNHPSFILPVEAGGSSTTGFADGVWTNAPTSGTRQWLSLGGLYSGSFTGLRYLLASGSLTYSFWNILGRLSATGRSRRRA